MWCRCYKGQVHVVILLQYLSLSQPRTVVEEMLGETVELFAYRSVSSGSSLVGAADDLGVPVSSMLEFS